MYLSTQENKWYRQLCLRLGCVCACVCMCGGGKGRLEFCCFLESGVLSLPPEKWLWGVCAGSFQRSGLVIALTKRVGKFFFIRVGQAIFHHKLEINWNHRFARDQIRMTAASTVSLVCITVSNFPYPLYRKEHQHVEPIYQNFSKIKIRKQKYV